MSLNLATGNFSSGAHPTTHRPSELVRRMARDLADGASLDLRFAQNLFYRRNLSTGTDEVVPAIELLGSHTRASEKWYPAWSGRSGNKVGRLARFGVDERAYGAFGAADEAAGINYLRNPRIEGGAAGTPGTLPSFWSASFTSTVLETSAVRSYQGWRVLPIALTGGSNGDSEFFFFEEPGAIPAAQGETVVFSIVMRVSSGSLAGFEKVELQVTEYDAGAASVANSSTVGNLNVSGQGLDGSLRRFVFTYTPQAAACASVVPLLRFRITTGSQIAVEFEVGAPQLEKGVTAATSPMFPPALAPGVSTRAADAVTGITITRPSWAWYLDWDFTNGGEVRGQAEFAPNVPRNGRRGLLIERLASTNYIRNPRGESVVANAPALWLLSATDTVTVNVTHGRDEEGADFVEVAFVGAYSGGQFHLAMEGQNTIPAAAAEAWCFSAGVMRTGGSGTNVTSIQIRFDSRDAGATLQTHPAVITAAVDRQHRRHWFTAQTAAGTQYVQPRISFYFAAGAAGDTYRIYLPQMEKGAVPTSPITPAPGTTAASTRSADVLDITGATGNWSNDNGAGTMMADVHLPITLASAANNPRIVSYGSAAGDNFEFYYDPALQKPRIRAVDGGSVQVDMVPAAVLPPGQDLRIAASWAPNDAHGCINGETLDDNALTVAFGAGTLHIGDRPGGATPMPTMFVGRIAYWPSARADAAVDGLGA